PPGPRGPGGRLGEPGAGPGASPEGLGRSGGQAGAGGLQRSVPTSFPPRGAKGPKRPRLALCGGRGGGGGAPFLPVAASSRQPGQGRGRGAGII
ncbi:hypothetical protein ABTP06_19985, partial [Acinetobacter baumannii]